MIALLAILVASVLPADAPRFSARVKFTDDGAVHELQVGKVELPQHLAAEGWECQLKDVAGKNGLYRQALNCTQDGWVSGPSLYAYCGKLAGTYQKSNKQSMVIGDAQGVAHFEISCETNKGESP